MSFRVGHLWTGHMSAWLSIAGSKHKLHHSPASSTPFGVMMSFFYSHSSSSLNGFCSVVLHTLERPGMAYFQALFAIVMCHQNSDIL